METSHFRKYLKDKGDGNRLHKSQDCQRINFRLNLTDARQVGYNSYGHYN